jgi:hypothetical protein
LPLRIGAASTKLYIERGADWCGQGKNNSFFEGCGMSTCPYGSCECVLSLLQLAGVNVRVVCGRKENLRRSCAEVGRMKGLQVARIISVLLNLLIGVGVEELVHEVACCSSLHVIFWCGERGPGTKDHLLYGCSDCLVTPFDLALNTPGLAEPPLMKQKHCRGEQASLYNLSSAFHIFIEINSFLF